jgi:hypothetical protein
MNSLETAARHCRTAAQHFRDGEIPRASAHAWAAFGQMREADKSLTAQADPRPALKAVGPSPAPVRGNDA